MVSERLLSSRSRIILLVLATISLPASGVLYQKGNYTAGIALFIAAIIFMIIINRIYNSTNDAISFLFNSLRNDDTTVRFNEKTGNKSLSGLNRSINKLNDHFQAIKIRSESNESYFRTVIQHASTGLLVLGKNDTVELINKNACIYAGISPDSTNPDQLKIKHPDFYEAACRLRPGETTSYKNLVSGNLQLLFFRAVMIRRKDEELKLVTIQDLRPELEAKELESYRKLISVLTHEIMNHLSPLTSVARELSSLLGQKDSEDLLPQINEDVIKTTVNGLKMINEQSDGLISFMNNYRKISRIPPPDFSAFAVDEWIDQLRIAFSVKMRESNIEFRISADKSLKEIIADRKLLNQVMINLINNSYDAVMENETGRKIEIRLTKNQLNRTMISVYNNGPAIPPELHEKIFVPFFTTKRNGSGIGLSLSQEIMKMHKGSLVAISSEKEKTCFIIEF